MKLRVKPIYGFGWFRAGEQRAIEVPTEFELDAEVVEPGAPPKLVLGQVTQSDHVLAGFWVALALRTRGDHPTFNVVVYSERPVQPFAGTHVLSGYAMAEDISN